jgi:uncharacterized protein (TIGR03083 family)
VIKGEIVRATQAERRRTLTLVRRLEPAQFDVLATPGWRVREVLAHLITMDRASVLGSNLAQVLTSSERIERWNDRQVSKWADRSIPELLLGLDRWGRRLVRLFRAVPAPLYRLRAPTFLGRAPLGLLISTRVYDEWVHRQDIRRALGLPDEDVDVSSAAEVLLTAIGVNTVPQLRGRTGSVAISLKDAPVSAWRYDLASGGMSGPEARGQDPPDARISAAAPAFIMAAAGRDAFGDLLGGGTISIEGDEPLAVAFLDALRIV